MYADQARDARYRLRDAGCGFRDAGCGVRVAGCGYQSRRAGILSSLPVPARRDSLFSLRPSTFPLAPLVVKVGLQFGGQRP